MSSELGLRGGGDWAAKKEKGYAGDMLPRARGNWVESVVFVSEAVGVVKLRRYALEGKDR